MRRHPTQADVAARAGVSRALVSMALSGRPEVAESTRELILRASRDIGYLVNAPAANLARRRTKLLGVVLQDVSNPFFCEVAAHVQDAAAAAGLTTLLNDGRRDATREARAVKTFLQLRVDGLIIVAPSGRHRPGGHRAPGRDGRGGTPHPVAGGVHGLRARGLGLRSPQSHRAPPRARASGHRLPRCPRPRIRAPHAAPPSRVPRGDGAGRVRRPNERCPGCHRGWRCRRARPGLRRSWPTTTSRPSLRWAFWPEPGSVFLTRCP